MSGNSLTPYQRLVLNKIITDFDGSNDLNIYELIKTAVSQKCILASQNALIMETYFVLKEHLVSNRFMIEKQEMSSYILTEKGRKLRTCKSLDEFEKQALKKDKQSFIRKIFFSSRKDFTSENVNNKTLRQHG